MRRFRLSFRRWEGSWLYQQNELIHVAAFSNARAALFKTRNLEVTVVGFVPIYIQISTTTLRYDDLESLFEINHCLSDLFELIKTPAVSLILGGNVDMRGAGIGGGKLSYLQQLLPKIDDFASPLALLLEVIYHEMNSRPPVPFSVRLAKTVMSQRVYGHLHPFSVSLLLSDTSSVTIHLSFGLCPGSFSHLMASWRWP